MGSLELNFEENQDKEMGRRGRASGFALIARPPPFGKG